MDSITQAALGAKIEIPTLKGPDELELPAGTQSGEVFRLARKGMPDPRSGRVGNLLVRVYVEVPKSLTPKEEELLRALAAEEDKNVIILLIYSTASWSELVKTCFQSLILRVGLEGTQR